jgi:hypothetical protein
MEGKFQTSFIPKAGLTPNGVGRPVHTTNFFTLIATVVFITSIALGLAVFGYKYYLDKNNTKLKSGLQTELAKFEPSLVAELSRLDNRIESTKDLLNNHIALSSFFSFLSEKTLKTVRFTNFRYAIDTASNKITVTMDGQAQSFSAVALQADQFSDTENQHVIQEPLFSGLTLDEKGNIKFTFTGKVNPSELLYRNIAKDTTSAVVVSTGTTTTASSTRQ